MVRGMNIVGCVTRSQMIDLYTRGSIEPLATFDSDMGDHYAIVEALEGEETMHLVMISLPIGGRGGTLVSRVRYFQSGKPYIRSRHTYYHLDKFVARSDEWNNILQEVNYNE